MSPAEILELLKKIRDGDRAAQEILINEYRLFIYSTAVFEKNNHEIRFGIVCGITNEEIFDEGVVGLLKSATDENCWEKFDEVAKGKISDEIKIAILNDVAFKSFISCFKEEFSLYRKIRTRLFKKLQRSPTPTEIEKKLKWSALKIKQFEKFYEVALDYEDV